MNDILDEISKTGSVDTGRIMKVRIDGNTTMTHLVLKVSPYTLSRYPFEPVFTGMQTAKAADLGLHDAFAYIGSVCVVDAETFPELSEVLPAIKSQIEYCSAAVINKTDLADENKIESAEAKIREYNPTVKIFRASYCGVDIKSIVEAMHIHAGIPAGKESSNTMENRADSFVISGDKAADPEDLRAFIEEIAGDSYRIKGFVLSSKGPVQVSTVNDNIYITPWDGRLEKSELIIISAVGFRMMTTITKALDKHLKGVMKI